MFSWLKISHSYVKASSVTQLCHTVIVSHSYVKALSHSYVKASSYYWGELGWEGVAIKPANLLTVIILYARVHSV